MTNGDEDNTAAPPPAVTEPAQRAVQTSQRRQRPRANYVAAVYGSVLAASVVVSSGDLRALSVLAILLVVSGLVFWIAHVYAATVAGVHGGWHYGAIATGMRHEWPVAFASIPPAIAAVVCALLPNVTVSGGAWAAVIVAIIELQVWGYAAVRSVHLTGRALTRTLLLNVLIGLVIVLLKVGVGH